MPAFTTAQWLAILIGVLSAVAGGTAQLTPVFGSESTHLIVSVANLVMTIIVTPVLFVITGQSGLVKTVQAMPGVDRIQVNGNATSTLAQLAIDPAQDKIEATPGQESKVESAAKT